MLAETTVVAPELTRAFETFTAATARLEREYRALQRKVVGLTAELEEKNRLLAESVVRERRLEADVLRQSRLAAMGEMAAMLAHEVRNPLGAMELFTGLLLQDLREQPAAHHLARQVATGITDLNHLVTNLLEFTRRRSAELVPVDCGALLDDALRWTEHLRAPDVVVDRRMVDVGAAAMGDPALLRPVLVNLLRNALQAMPVAGRLTLVVAVADDAVQVAVADTGPGIADEQREDIFRPFFTTRAKGTGLGLTIVRELVAAMDGRLQVDSEVGRGTTFTVCLRAAERDGR